MSGFGVCPGDGHMVCEVLVSGTEGSGTSLHIQTLGPWGSGSLGGVYALTGTSGHMQLDSLPIFFLKAKPKRKNGH